MTEPIKAKPAPKPKKEMIAKKYPMPHQEGLVRAKNFNEVALGLTEELAMKEADRCIFCKKAPCIAGCPVEIDIPGFIALIKDGKFLEAAAKIKEKNALPAICGRVCPQEDQCEIVCTMGVKHEPVAIGRLERFAADYEAASGQTMIPEKAPPTGKKVAVVGAGPAGLTVAGDLVLWGYSVTVFEALHKAGGVLVYGIPEFRLPKDIVQREIEYLQKLGVEIRLNSVVGKTVLVDELLKEYDAVFLANGAGLPTFMNIPGENHNGVYSANEYLTRSNLMKAYLFPQYDTPIKKGKNVAVIGGGNVAMDGVRTALRLGADNAYIIYRRSRTEMPARVEEVDNAGEEGVQFKMLTNPVRIIANNEGWVEAIECLKMELGEPDESGRRRPVPIKGSEFQIPVDTVVMAIGNGANPLIARSTPGLATNKWGNYIANEENGRTTKERVWAGGDIVTGAATVILAMGAGRNAARDMDKYLKSKTPPAWQT